MAKKATTEPKYTNRQLAEIADVPLRVFERVAVVVQQGIPELMAALEADRIKAGPAERIARLPQDRQLAELEAHLNRKPVKRPGRTVMTDLKRIAIEIDSAAERWTADDRKIAACILSGIADGLRGDNADEQQKG